MSNKTNGDSENNSANNLAIEQLTESIKGKTILIKYGGNAMLDDALKDSVIEQISFLKDAGAKPIIVHGGGPFIKNLLKLSKIESEFIGGQRVTTSKAMRIVEMALKGEVNGDIVTRLNNSGQSAVGISGKDGKTVIAKKRYHIDESGESKDIGYVGDPKDINTKLVNLLLDNDFIPVIAPVSIGEDGKEYNINADIFAGNLAAGLKADNLLILTDVDGLLKDIGNPDSIINELHVNEAQNMMGSIIKGGMIPKIESCIISVESGVSKSAIINGTKNKTILNYFIKGNIGTTIKK